MPDLATSIFPQVRGDLSTLSPLCVILSPSEQLFWGQVALARQLRAMQAGRVDKVLENAVDKLLKGDNSMLFRRWGVHVEGAGGEGAVARLLGLEARALKVMDYVDKFNDTLQRDVAGCEIKTTSRINLGSEWHVPLRCIKALTDPETCLPWESPFVYVWGIFPIYYILGWAWTSQLTHCPRNKRELVALLPLQDLHPPRSLRVNWTKLLL